MGLDWIEVESSTLHVMLYNYVLVPDGHRHSTYIHTYIHRSVDG